MRFRLQNKGSMNRGTIGVWSNEDRSVEVQISVMALRPDNGREIWPDGSTIPAEIEVDMDLGVWEEGK